MVTKSWTQLKQLSSSKPMPWGHLHTHIPHTHTTGVSIQIYTGLVHNKDTCTYISETSHTKNNTAMCTRTHAPALSPTQRGNTPAPDYTRKHGHTWPFTHPPGAPTNRQITGTYWHTPRNVNPHGAPKPACVRSISGMAQTWKREGQVCTCWAQQEKQRVSEWDLSDPEDHRTAGGSSRLESELPSYGWAEVWGWRWKKVMRPAGWVLAQAPFCLSLWPWARISQLQTSGSLSVKWS